MPGHLSGTPPKAGFFDNDNQLFRQRFQHTKRKFEDGEFRNKNQFVKPETHEMNRPDMSGQFLATKVHT